MGGRLTGRRAWMTVGMVAAAWFFVSAPASFAQFATCLGQVATLEGTTAPASQNGNSMVTVAPPPDVEP